MRDADQADLSVTPGAGSTPTIAGEIVRKIVVKEEVLEPREIFLRHEVYFADSDVRTYGVVKGVHFCDNLGTDQNILPHQVEEGISRDGDDFCETIIGGFKASIDKQ